MAKRSAVESGPVRSGTRNVSLDKIEGKYRFHTIHHEEGGVSSQLVGGGAISPKGKGHDHRPSGFIAFACLENGVADRAVLLFDNAVCLGVVRRYADVSDAELVSEPVERCNVSCAIVSDDLLYCSPPSSNMNEPIEWLTCDVHVSLTPRMSVFD